MSGDEGNRKQRRGARRGKPRSGIKLLETTKVRAPDVIAEEVYSPDAPKHIVEMVEHLRRHGLRDGGNTAAAALEALFWIGRARAYDWIWLPGEARNLGPVEEQPAAVGVPGWVVEALAKAWVGFSRDKTPPTLDEAFGVKPDVAVTRSFLLHDDSRERDGVADGG